MTIDFINSDHFHQQLTQTGRSPVARLVGLSNILNRWNTERLDQITNKQAADLSINDIQVLKTIITEETAKTKVKQAEIIADQILFLLIGAIKLQIQNQSENPWALVNQSIESFLKPAKSTHNPMLALSLLMFAVIIGFAIAIGSMQKQAAPNTAPMPLSPINVAGSKTVTNLVSVYQAMKGGECQLPQAAMLQPQERAAFVTFITEGKVAISTADDLKAALAHTTCQYPQKLMNNPLNVSPKT